MSTPIRIYDSFRRQKLAFEPLRPGQVSVYLCGPTPYTAAHIGHAYSAICFDVIRRSLGWLGYQVTFVRNVTDVDDKIINAGRATGRDPVALAAQYADEYNHDMATLGVLPPDIEPRVSTHIAEIIALVERLVASGKAYVVDGDVYFEVASFPEYGQLSGMSLDELRAGERVAVDERKRAPADFALWKSAKPGEPHWTSPWGEGRPGWHIECSAMCHRHLGETFDLHGGGKDLIFPHHENEIAQSQGAYGTQSFARYWLHNGFLNFEGIKMSRSLGNVFDIAQIVAGGGPEALRFFVVSHHYRSPVDFEVEALPAEPGKPTAVRFRSLEAADRRLEYFYVTLQRLDTFVAGLAIDDGAVLPDAEKLLTETREALADDFNAPVVVASLGEAAKLANKLLDEGKGIDKAVRRRTLARLQRDLRSAGAALGILTAAPSEWLLARRDRLVKRRGLDAPAIDALVAERTAARAGKDFARADEIRGQLTALGVECFDSPQGTVWRVLDAE